MARACEQCHKEMFVGKKRKYCDECRRKRAVEATRRSVEKYKGTDRAHDNYVRWKNKNLKKPKVLIDYADRIASQVEYVEKERSEWNQYNWQKHGAKEV